jgi:signal transduction histidine kinase
MFSVEQLSDKILTTFCRLNGLFLYSAIILIIWADSEVKAQSNNINLDSLFRVIATKNPDAQMAVLVPVWEQNAEFSVAQSESIMRAIEGLHNRTGKTSSKILYYRAKALSSYYRNQLSEAFHACEKAMELPIRTAQDSLSLIQVLFVRGRAYHARGELGNAAKDFNTALRLAHERRAWDKSKQLNTLIAKLYLFGGLIDIQRDDLSAAEQKFTDTRLIFKKLNDKIGIALADAYTGNLYIKQKNYVRAEALLRSSLNTFLKAQAYHQTARVYSYFGHMEMERGTVDDALLWYNKCIQIDSSNHKLISLQDHYLDVARALLENSNYKAAKQYINEAKQVASATDNQYALMLAYDMESELYYATGNFRKAYESQQIGNTHRNKVYDEQLLTEIAKSRTESAQAKIIDSLRMVGIAKQKEAAAEKALNEQLSLYLYLLIGAAIVILMLVFGLINANKKLKRKNIELNNKNTRLDRALIDLELTQKQYAQSEKLAALGKLSGGIAHEILNPMNYINNGTQQLEKGIKRLIAANEEYRRMLSQFIPEQDVTNQSREQQYALLQAEVYMFLDIIKSGVNKILGIVQSIRQLKPPDFKSADIHNTIENALQMLSAQYADIEVERRYEKQCPQVLADHLQLERVFTNIISNAFQAIRMAKRTHGKITITTNFFSLGKNNDKLFVRVEIQDNGIGMTDQVKQQIYEPFFTTKEVGSGMGLGLYITKQILDLHQAKIDIISEQNVGTNFIIALPVNGLN